MQSSAESIEATDIGVVIIGRNEGARLIECLESVVGRGHAVVYVDSGSEDGSPEAAARLGADVVALDMATPFTAARARNAGFEQLEKTGAPTFVQFVDGDCAVIDGWIETAAQFLRDNDKVAVACGAVREKFPERSIFNRLCDREWATPEGETAYCGGNAMMRARAFKEAGGFRETLIAGEEPELCVRLRMRDWKIMRLGSDMVRHDIAMTSLGQWLKRARRAGHAYGEVSTLHPGAPERIWVRQTRRALAWSGLLALGLIGGLLLHPLLFLLLALFPAQIARIALRDKPATQDSWAYGALLVLQKPWEAAGVIQYWIGRLGKRSSSLIEYKSPSTEGNSN